MKHLARIVCAAVLIVGLLLGSFGTAVLAESGEKSNFNPTGYPIVNEKITLKGFGNQNTTHSDWDTLLCFNDYEEISNIHIEWTTAPNEGYDEKKNLLLASGDYPDFFYRANLTVSDQITYGGLGMLLRINDLIEQYAPNFMERVAEYPEALKGITMPGGDIYSLPYVQPIDLPTGFQKNWINTVWLERLGLEMPETTEEVYQVLKAFKESDANGNGDPNDELPYSCRNKGVSIFRSTYGSFGIGNLGTTASDAYIDRGADGKVRFFATTDEYKKQLEWITKLYSEGLMDPEMFTQGTADFTAKANQDLIGAFFSNDNNQQLGTHTNDFDTIRVPTGPDGHKQFNHIGPTVSSGRFAISSSNPYPEETMRWIDYYYGHEGAILIRLGREGVSYHVNEDGTFRLDEDISNNQDGMTVSQAMGRYAIGFAGGGCPEFIFKDIEMTRLPADSQRWVDTVIQDFDPEEVTPITFLFTKEEQNEMNALSSDIRGFVDEMRIAFVTGKRSLDEWDSFVNEVNRMGVDRYVELHQASYDRYLAE